MNNCYFCGEPFNERVYRNSECSSCHRDLKICYNCYFYNKNAPLCCNEPQAEEVKEKDKSNFCEYFKAGGTLERDHQKSKAAKDAFEGLFS